MPEQIGVVVEAAAARTVRKGTVITSEIRDEANVLEGFVFSTGFPAVQIRMARDSYGATRRASRRAYEPCCGHRRAEVGVAAEHLELVLRAQRSSGEENKEQNKDHPGN